MLHEFRIRNTPAVFAKSTLCGKNTLNGINPDQPVFQNPRRKASFEINRIDREPLHCFIFGSRLKMTRVFGAYGLLERYFTEIKSSETQRAARKGGAGYASVISF